MINVQVYNVLHPLISIITVCEKRGSKWARYLKVHSFYTFLHLRLRPDEGPSKEM